MNKNVTERPNNPFGEHHEQRRLLILCGLGGMLEFYDFIIYALLAGVLATQFFPTGNSLTSALATFATFALGYLARPLGGVIFGHFGDVSGRKHTFMMTILLMAVSTFLIGLVPTYNQIGVTGTIILVILRVVQGLSIGGEIPGAITYISECMPEKRGWSTGVIFFFLVNGITAGSLIHWWAASTMSAHSFNLWGWRVLFFVGGFFGLINFFLRKKIQESPLFSFLNTHKKFPLAEVFRYKKVATIFGVVLAGTGAALITTFYLFIPSYLKMVVKHTPDLFLFASVIGCFFASLIILFFGYLSDRINRIQLVITCFLASAVLSVPVFAGWAHGALWWPMFIGALLFGCAWGVIPSLLSNLFETDIRFSGIAASYNIGFAIFAGLGPLICFSLVELTGHKQAPAYYLVILSGIALVLSVIACCSSKVRATHHPHSA